MEREDVPGAVGAWTSQNVSIFTCESQKIPIIPH